MPAKQTGTHGSASSKWSTAWFQYLSWKPVQLVLLTHIINAMRNLNQGWGSAQAKTYTFVPDVSTEKQPLPSFQFCRL